jgi:hypothetical protein
MTPSEIIDRLGGTSKVAKECGIRMQSVSVWRKTVVPPARLMYFRLKYPEVFANEESLLPSEPHSTSQLQTGN